MARARLRSDSYLLGLGSLELSNSPHTLSRTSVRRSSTASTRPSRDSKARVNWLRRCRAPSSLNGSCPGAASLLPCLRVASSNETRSERVRSSSRTSARTSLTMAWMLACDGLPGSAPGSIGPFALICTPVVRARAKETASSLIVPKSFSWATLVSMLDASSDASFGLSCDSSASAMSCCVLAEPKTYEARAWRCIA
eukprot:scaffold155383_cov33-Tisochrysis_lutea.AAC.2